MNDSFFSSLNEIQKQAVLETSYPIVVCAGAGSGKTRVISYRVAHIIKNLNFSPNSILCVTFTNKAANEMKERVENLTPEYEDRPTITTFHGFALRLIRKYGKYLDIQDFTIIDEDARESLIKNIIDLMFSQYKEITVKNISYFISSLKNKTFKEDYISGKIYELYNAVYVQYEILKKKSKNLDFDDLLLKCLELIQIPEILKKLREEIRHILVDEYQDTNYVQHEIIKALSIDENKNFILDTLCVVGDEDQSIYSWRGANVYNMTDFKKDFKTAKTITLAQNYRSTKEILSLANEVIKKNTIRNHKDLWTEKIIKDSTFLFSCASGYQEASLVSRAIKIISSKKNESCAILYRSHYQSRLFEEELISNSIPYKIFGGINFYERMEIKDILSYLFLASNLYDRSSFLRCCNTPTRGLGDVFQDEFITFWNNVYSDKNILEFIPIFIEDCKPTTKTINSLKILEKVLMNIREKKESPDLIIKWLIKEINYENHLQKVAETEKEKTEKMENLAELSEAARIFNLTESGDLSQFIDQIALMYNSKVDTDSQKNVILMSLHSAKGLEFSTVFLVGLEDGIIPNSRNILNLESLEEERRLLYVGITRACNRLILTHAIERNIWGTTKYQQKSRFIEKIPLNNLICTNFAGIPVYALNNYLEKIFIENDYNFKVENNFSKNNYSENNNFENKIKSFFSFGKKNLINETTEVKNSKFNLNEKINHQIFGVGKIIKIENDLYEVSFADGIKKIKENFIQKID